jgi:hypothetical protein
MAGFNLVPAEPPVVLAGSNAAVVDPGDGSSSGPIPVAGVAYDWLVDGVPFLMYPTEDDPYMRDMQEDTKDQFDASQEAGEQSFGYWWLRSQASYNGGAGQTFLDSTNDEVTRIRYFTSNYVDPFTTQGQVTVADGFNVQVVNRRASALVTWDGVARLATASSADNSVFVADVPDLDNSDEIEVGTTGTCQAMCTDGESLYVAIDDSVYRIDDSGTDTKIATVSFIGPVTIGFAKARIILTTGPQVYEIDPNPDTPPTAYTDEDAVYIHPSENWQYTSVADGPNGIYLAGYLGPLSELSLMTVEDAGDGLVLGQPVVQLRTPPSEIIHGVAFYLNAFFGLATSSGIRVGQFTPYGQPQYGPVLNPGNPAFAVAGSGSLLYFGGVNRVWSVDLGTQVADGRYAYAQYGDNINPVSATDNVVTIEVAVVDQHDKLFGVQASGGVFYQSSDPPSPPFGTLTTSYARFGTVEPKRLHYIRLEGTFPDVDSGVQTTVTVESIDGDSRTYPVPGGRTFYEIGVTDFPTSEAFRLIFNIAPGTVLRSWQQKSRPAPLQYQQLYLPLGVYDYEMAADGQQVGYDGYALDRLLRLEEAARSNRIVTVVDKWANIQNRAQISRCQFRQTVEPGSVRRLGGRVTLVLRLI